MTLFTTNQVSFVCHLFIAFLFVLTDFMVYMKSLLLYEIFISIYVSFQVQAVAAFVTILRFRI